MNYPSIPAKIDRVLERKVQYQCALAGENASSLLSCFPAILQSPEAPQHQRFDEILAIVEQAQFLKFEGPDDRKLCEMVARHHPKDDQTLKSTLELMTCSLDHMPSSPVLHANARFLLLKVMGDDRRRASRPFVDDVVIKELASSLAKKLESAPRLSRTTEVFDHEEDPFVDACDLSILPTEAELQAPWTETSKDEELTQLPKFGPRVDSFTRHISTQFQLIRADFMASFKEGVHRANLFLTDRNKVHNRPHE